MLRQRVFHQQERHFKSFSASTSVGLCMEDCHYSTPWRIWSYKIWLATCQWCLESCHNWWGPRFDCYHSAHQMWMPKRTWSWKSANVTKLSWNAQVYVHVKIMMDVKIFVVKKAWQQWWLISCTNMYKWMSLNFHVDCNIWKIYTILCLKHNDTNMTFNMALWIWKSISR